jgi:hypothetical protein
MSEKNLLEGRTGPVTQSVAAIKSLLILVGRSADPLPADVSLDNGRLVLILSNKKDAYYTCTARACSCPGNQFRHNCKHQRKYFPQAQEQAATKPTASEPLIKRGGFKPFDELPGERAAKASSLSAIDVAYHSIREDKMEA